MRFLACICPFKRENDGCRKSYEKFLLSAQKAIFALFSLKKDRQRKTLPIFTYAQKSARGYSASGLPFASVSTLPTRSMMPSIKPQIPEMVEPAKQVRTVMRS